MKALLTEFIGTFFLVLTIGLVVATGTDLAPIAIGSVLMVMVYMGGHVSGAYYNPAVALAGVMRGVLPTKDFGPYVVAQVLGATLAAYASSWMVGSTFAPEPSGGVVAALLAETLYTFALTLVVLNVAVSAKTKGNSYYGLAIGFTVMAAAFAVGGISGAAFNPAVGIGATVINALLANGSWNSLWIYIVGPITGAALAAVAFGVQERSEA